MRNIFWKIIIGLGMTLFVISAIKDYYTNH